jgi:hypothetical protein
MPIAGWAQAMGITVGRLVSDPLLKTRIIAGVAGAVRLIPKFPRSSRLR